jgi:hypothetical protein
MKRLSVLLAAVLCACGPGLPQGLSILSIEPASKPPNGALPVTLQLDVVPPFRVDYNHEQAEVLLQELEVEIGPSQLKPAKYEGHGRYSAVVGPDVPSGVHDVRVRLADGREAVLPQGFTVAPSITGFWIETIPDQEQEVPFALTLHVTGQGANEFTGRVTVSINQGRFILSGQQAPTRSFESGPFVGGERQELVAIDTAGSNFLIGVEGGNGQTAWSNAFSVNPKK